MDGWRSRVGVGVGVVVAVVAVLALASSESGSRPAPTPPVRVGPACRGGVAQHGYAVTGDVYQAVLRTLTLCPPALGAPILADGPTQRVSWLSGSAQRAIVAEFSTGQDRIALLADDRLVPVPGFAGLVGHAPSLAPDGRFTYIEKQVADSGGFVFSVVLADPDTGRTERLLRLTAPPSDAVWGPDGRLALIGDAGGDGAHLLLLDRPGAKARRVADLPRQAISLLWPSSGDLILLLAGATPEAGRAVVLDPATGRTRVEVDPAWRPVGLTPDGALLAVRSSTRELARLAAPRYDAPEVYGALPDGQQVWKVVL